MRTLTASIAILGTVVLGACGDRDKETKPVDETVFGDMVENKQRAQADVDKAMQENQKKLEATMQKQEAAE